MIDIRIIICWSCNSHIIAFARNVVHLIESNVDVSLVKGQNTIILMQQINFNRTDGQFTFPIVRTDGRTDGWPVARRQAISHPVYVYVGALASVFNYRFRPEFNSMARMRMDSAAKLSEKSPFSSKHYQVILGRFIGNPYSPSPPTPVREYFSLDCLPLPRDTARDRAREIETRWE